MLSMVVIFALRIVSRAIEQSLDCVSSIKTIIFFIFMIKSRLAFAFSSLFSHFRWDLPRLHGARHRPNDVRAGRVASGGVHLGQRLLPGDPQIARLRQRRFHLQVCFWYRSYILTMPTYNTMYAQYIGAYRVFDIKMLFSKLWFQHFYYLSKGQSISKCPFVVFKWTKKQTNFL